MMNRPPPVQVRPLAITNKPPRRRAHKHIAGAGLFAARMPCVLRKLSARHSSTRTTKAPHHAAGHTSGSHRHRRHQPREFNALLPSMIASSDAVPDKLNFSSLSIVLSLLRETVIPSQDLCPFHFQTSVTPELPCHAVL